MDEKNEVFKSLVPRNNFIGRLRTKWIQYNDFSFRDILKLIKSRFSGFITIHCAYSIIAQRLFDTPIKTVIDVGAHNGDYARSAKHIFPQAKIYCFEPTEVFREIRGKDIQKFNFALWNKTGKGKFFKMINKKTKKPGGGSSFFNNKAIKKYAELYGQEIEEIEIERKRFDELDIKIERPCLLKVDVEGSEFEVLKGFGKKLDFVDVIQLEYIFEEVYNRNNFIKIISMLNKKGFNFIQPITTWYKNMPGSNDLIFFRQKKVN